MALLDSSAVAGSGAQALSESYLYTVEAIGRYPEFIHAFWVSIGLAVGGLIWWGYGSEFGLQYFAGYVIEKSLAIDNVFVWAMIFSYFAVPRQYQHRVLFYGVIGALVFRAIFIALGSALLHFQWMILVFGGILIAKARDLEAMRG